MSGKRLMIGRSTWGVDDADFESVMVEVRYALENASVATLPLLDEAGRPVTVLLNGRMVEFVVFDLDLEPRPGEIS